MAASTSQLGSPNYYPNICMATSLTVQLLQRKATSERQNSITAVHENCAFHYMSLSPQSVSMLQFCIRRKSNPINWINSLSYYHEIHCSSTTIP
jgi:hypothetical protein